MINAYEDAVGSIDSPNCDFHPERLDRDDINISDEFIYELNDGMFCHFHMAPHGINLVDSILKDLLEKFAEKEFVEFIPVLVKSKEYGDREYYILHFTKIFDVIDKDSTIYVDGTDAIIKLALDYDKVKDLHLFNSQPSISDVIISDEIRRQLKKEKLDEGIEFVPITCVKR